MKLWGDGVQVEDCCWEKHIHCSPVVFRLVPVQMFQYTGFACAYNVHVIGAYM